MSTLPHGYIQYDEHTAIHMSVVRRFSPDPDRFLKVLPDINDASKHDPQDVIDTMRDSAELDLALAEFLTTGTGLEGFPQPLFFVENAS